MAEAGLADRIAVDPGDLTQGPPGIPLDAAAPRHVPQAAGPEAAAAILRHVGAAMRAGAPIHVLGRIPNDDRLSTRQAVTSTSSPQPPPGRRGLPRLRPRRLAGRRRHRPRPRPARHVDDLRPARPDPTTTAQLAARAAGARAPWRPASLLTPRNRTGAPGRRQRPGALAQVARAPDNPASSFSRSHARPRDSPPPFPPKAVMPPSAPAVPFRRTPRRGRRHRLRTKSRRAPHERRTAGARTPHERPTGGRPGADD